MWDLTAGRLLCCSFFNLCGPQADHKCVCFSRWNHPAEPALASQNSAQSDTDYAAVRFCSGLSLQVQLSWIKQSLRWSRRRVLSACTFIYRVYFWAKEVRSSRHAEAGYKTKPKKSIMCTHQIRRVGLIKNPPGRIVTLTKHLTLTTVRNRNSSPQAHSAPPRPPPLPLHK